MRASLTMNGITLRVVAGTTSVILGIDLQQKLRKDCLGFSIRRTDLGATGPGTGHTHAKSATAATEKGPSNGWLPNMLSFPSRPAPKTAALETTLDAPLQKFRWGDYTTQPGRTYRYQVVPRYGRPGALTPAAPSDRDGITVEVTTEDDQKKETAVFFNRAAAASRAFGIEFPNVTTESLLLGDTKEAAAARQWLSRGLEEAMVAFLEKAKDKTFALHAAIYEFQKPELLAALLAAKERGAEVHVVYHHRSKGDADQTASKNDAAIKNAKLPSEMLTQRSANPQGAIMHNKFVVLLQRKGGSAFEPQAVWTGSTNWTDGALYGQLNVGHAVWDSTVAETYEAYYQLLESDADAATMKHEVDKLTPVSVLLPKEHGVTPIFSPQDNDTMLHLYASICAAARCVMVSAPFAVSPIVLTAFTTKAPEGAVRLFLLDKEASLGKGQEVQVIENDPSTAIGVATTLPSALHDFQGKLLENKESFRHAGIHIHSKIILADPFGTEPTLITGSANFSKNSTETNDSNSLMIHGDTAVADIYATEFMRMFEHYHFRASEAKALKDATARGKSADASTLALVEDDSWSKPYYVVGSHEEADRKMFAGTTQ